MLQHYNANVERTKELEKVRKIVVVMASLFVITNTKNYQTFRQLNDWSDIRLNNLRLYFQTGW